MGFLNVEIKARCNNQEKIREILKAKNADFNGEDHQIDTYFKVNFGRLKLREGDIENSLIFYDREDKNGPKNSNCVLLKLDLNSVLKEALIKSLGVLVVVDKKREIYFIENVKFHIDKVKELGTFVEIEARDYDNVIGKEKLLGQCNHYLELFKISENDLIAVSYSDMLLNSE